MSRGKPFEPGNKFGRGRPKGSLNKSTLLAQKLFEEHSAAIMATAINKCRDDPQMLRMMASRIIPRAKESPVNIGSLPCTTLADLDEASQTILKKATTGRISIAQAVDLSTIIDRRRVVLLTQDLERRIAAVESKQVGSGP